MAQTISRRPRDPGYLWDFLLVFIAGGLGFLAFARYIHAHHHSASFLTVATIWPLVSSVSFVILYAFACWFNGRYNTGVPRIKTSFGSQTLTYLMGVILAVTVTQMFDPHRTKPLYQDLIVAGVTLFALGLINMGLNLVLANHFTRPTATDPARHSAD